METRAGFTLVFFFHTFAKLQPIVEVEEEFNYCSLGDSLKPILGLLEDH